MPHTLSIAAVGRARIAWQRLTEHAGQRLGILLAGAFALVIHFGMASHGIAPVFEGRLLDTDDYMRLVQVEHLWRSGDWFNLVISRIDPPNGLVLHWSRPMDVLLLAGAWAASPILGIHVGLFWWGALINPVLLLASLAAIVWAAKPVVPRTWLPLVAFLFVVLPGVLTRFMIGRPDHHGLLILLLILAMGFALRLVQDPERRTHALWAGLVGALAIWVSVESIIIVAIGIGSVGLCWLLGDRRHVRALGVHGASLAGGMALALLIERGPAGFGVVEIDKISLLHVVGCALNAALWLGLAGAEKRGIFVAAPHRRPIWLAIAGVGALLLIYRLFPHGFADPMGGGGDLYVRQHLAHVREVQPVLSLAALQGERWGAALGHALLWLGIAILALPWLAYRLSVGQAEQRRLWILPALAAVAYVPLTFFQVRWATYAEVVLVLPYADLAVAMAIGLSRRVSERAIGLVRPFLFFALFAWIYLPGAVAGTQDGAAEVISDQHSQCPINSLAEVLNDPGGLGASPKRVLAFIDFGPEILYRTPHAVLSIPNHRYQPGFIASYRVMTAADDSLAQDLLAERRVDLIAICPESAESWFYDTGDDAPTLFQSLQSETPPDFLTPVPLPVEAGAFRLFAVRLGN